MKEGGSERRLKPQKSFIKRCPQQQITRCMRFTPLTQIAPLRSTTSHTPKTLYAIAGREKEGEGLNLES